MRKMKLAELVLDYEIYPRNNVDSLNVRSLVEALESGAELPAIVIDKKSKRLVDGFHRYLATKRHLGEDASIMVIEKAYKDEAELFIDAIRFNAQHGAKLDPCDRARCTIIAERLHIPLDAVAGVLHVPTEKLGELRNNRTAKTHGGLTIPIKQTIRRWAGRTLNKRQIETNTRSSGMNQQFYVNQIIDLIEADLLDLEDEKLMKRLRDLHSMLDEVLAAK